MKKQIMAAMLAVSVASPAMLPAPAMAQHHDNQWHGDQRNWNPADNYQPRSRGERRLGRNDRIYRGRDGRAYCRRSDGSTGLVVGLVGGGVLGNLIGGGTLGTLLGAGGGALLGRSIDRGNVKCR